MLNPEEVMVSLKALWFSMSLRDGPALWEKGPGVMALDSTDWVGRRKTPPTTPAWSGVGAWLPAVIQAAPGLGALPWLRELGRGAPL